MKHAIATQLSALQTNNPTLSLDDVRKNLWILDKEAQLIRFKPNRAQLHYRANRTNRDIIVKSRQIGLSTEVQADDFSLAITSTALCATLAHDYDTTQKLRRMADRFYQNLPSNIQPPRGLDNATTTTYPSTNSEVTIATAGSGNIGRGGTYTRIHGSEVAFWKNAELIVAGLLQGATSNAVIRLESSPNGAQGYFYEKVNEALYHPDDSIWKVHFYQWWWADEYRIALDRDEVIEYTDEEQSLVNQHNLQPEQIKWRRYKIRELGHLFPQEYPEDIATCFLTSGGGVFTLRPENIYTGDTPRYEGDKTYYMQSPKQGAVCVAGMDWGQSEEYTSLSIFEVEVGQPPREVYINRWRKQDWYIMRAYAVDALEKYNAEKIVVERNSASSNIENLAKEIEERGIDCGVQAFTTSNYSKDKIVKLMQNGLEEHGTQLLDVDYANHEMRTFQTKQTPTGLWAYTHPDGGYDDCVDARLFANYAATQLWI